MGMFSRVAVFELRYQLKSPVFWGTGLIFFLLTFVAVLSDDVRIGWGGQVFRNAPYAVALTCMVMSIFAIFIVTAFVSNVVLRDDETGFGAIIQATPLSKSDYLFGRFAGGFVAACLAFASVPLGAFFALFLPGLDPETIGPIRIGDYFYVYFLFCVPTLFLLGAAMFALATITRSIMATYVGAVVVLALYLFTSAYLARPEIGASATLLDPFGLSSLRYETQNWTPSDRNSMLPDFLGLMLQNRAVWSGLGLFLLALAWRSFARRGFAGRVDPKPKRETRIIAQAPPPVQKMKPPSRRALGWGPLVALTRFELVGVFRGPAYIVLLGFAFINTIVALWLAGDDTVSVIYPVTRVMIQTLLDQFVAIPMFIAAFYAGELIWRDRERRINEIIDATPSPDWAFLAPKVFAISALLLTMGLASIGAAISVQLLKGFTTIELGHYFIWYLAPWFILMTLYAVLAIFIQLLVSHKFVGLLVMLLFYIVQLTLPRLGFEDNLYIYAGTSPVPLSDMNGLGRFAGYRAWYLAYWSAGAAILLTLTYALWRRGASAPLLARLKQLPRRLAGPAGGVAVVSASVMAVIGGYIYYNTHVLNDYRTYLEGERWAAVYEKTLMPFDSMPQPRITDVTMRVDVRPLESKIVTAGRYVVENRSGVPINQINLNWPRAQELRLFLGSIVVDDVEMRSLTVQGARLARDFPDLHHRVYAFETPMAPGERREIRFETVRQQKGFRNRNNDTKIVENGTFIDNLQIAPWLGVPRYPFIKDRATRRRNGLPAELKLAAVDDQSARAFNYLRRDSDWVNVELTIVSPSDQTALSTGRLMDTKIVGGRRITHFRSDAPVANFFPIQLAKYAVRKDRWKDIGLEVYYHKPHGYNIDRMINVMKSSLDYYTTNFSPYQFDTLRISEFPAYRNFAQAFPGNIPYSEASGFVFDSTKPGKIDYITYLSAHEIAHQWWGHQVVGADKEGSTVLTETLAQYSALMVMEKRYGRDAVRVFLKTQVDSYLGDRGNENVDEPTLERVEEQAYVRYQKGGSVMYLLRDQMGEEAVNRALRSLLQKYALKPAPYPGSRDLIDALRAQAKPEHQQLITDLFQRITLYDLKIADARATRRPDGKWNLVVMVNAQKKYADGKGVERLAPLNEQFDIGIFRKSPNADDFARADVIEMQKIRLQGGTKRLVFVTASKPEFVGIDPYIKYIDRDYKDNIANITLR